MFDHVGISQRANTSAVRRSTFGGERSLSNYLMKVGPLPDSHVPPHTVPMLIAAEQLIGPPSPSGILNTCRFSFMMRNDVIKKCKPCSERQQPLPVLPWCKHVHLIQIEMSAMESTALLRDPIKRRLSDKAVAFIIFCIKNRFVSSNRCLKAPLCCTQVIYMHIAGEQHASGLCRGPF